MYPLFKPGSSSLGGAYLRAHITSKPQFGPVHQVSYNITLGVYLWLFYCPCAKGFIPNVTFSKIWM
jgi:hypothetical protein